MERLDSMAWRRPHPSANSDQNRHGGGSLLLIIFLGRHARLLFASDIGPPIP